MQVIRIVNPVVKKQPLHKLGKRSGIEEASGPTHELQMSAFGSQYTVPMRINDRILKLPDKRRINDRIMKLPPQKRR